MKKILFSIALLTTGICMGSETASAGDTWDLVREYRISQGTALPKTTSTSLHSSDGFKLDDEEATTTTAPIKPSPSSADTSKPVDQDLKYAAALVEALDKTDGYYTKSYDRYVPASVGTASESDFPTASSTKVGGPFPIMKKAEVLKVLASPSTLDPVDKDKGIAHLIPAKTMRPVRIGINPATHAQYSDSDSHKYIDLNKESEKCTEKNIAVELPGVSDPHQAKTQDKHEDIDLTTKYMPDKEMVKYAPRLSLAEEYVFETTRTWRRSSTEEDRPTLGSSSTSLS